MLVREEYKKEWAAIDDALSHSRLEGLKSFEFHRKDTREYYDNHDIPILLELLPKFYDRGILGREFVSYFLNDETHRCHILTPYVPRKGH